MEENTIRLVSEALRTCIKALPAASEAMAAMDEELTKSTADVPVNIKPKSLESEPSEGDAKLSRQKQEPRYLYPVIEEG